jgi:predicted RNA-binding protein with PUA-like domain
MNHMAYWLLKTEPEEYSWDNLTSDQKTLWTGIRNFQARNNLRVMKPGDLAFIYHSGDEKAVVGVVRITAEAVPEKTDDKGEWAAVELEALKPLARQISLDELRNTPILSGMALIRQTRLSVSPVTEPEAKMLLKIGKIEL